MAGTGITNAELLDLQQTTLENLPRLNFETALNYQEYPVCNQWFQGDKMQIESGTSIKRNIILDTSGNARHVRLYQKTPINVADVHKQLTAPWVQVQTHYSIERREALRNRAPARYIDLLQSRRLDGMLDLADLFEEKAWQVPSTADDDLNPRGVPYWITAREDTITAATDQGAFSGFRIRFADGATNSTTKAGITSTGVGGTNPNWANWAAVYTSVNNDFVKRMRRAFHSTNFRSPMLVKDLKVGPSSKFRIYMDLAELSEYEDLVTSANDNLGRDLDPFHGITTFRRIPIIYTPTLSKVKLFGGSGTDNGAAGAVYGINHAKFYPIVQSGDWLRESEPMSDVEQHNVVTTFIDSSYQFFCNNIRQSGFVLHTTLTA